VTLDHLQSLGLILLAFAVAILVVRGWR